MISKRQSLDGADNLTKGCIVECLANAARIDSGTRGMV